MYTDRLSKKQIILKVLIFILINSFVSIPFLAFSQTVAVPNTSPEAASYHHLSNLIWIANIIFGICTATAFVYFSWSLKVLRYLSKITGEKKYLLLLFFAALFFLIQWIIRLPLLRIRNIAFGKLTASKGESLFQWTAAQFGESFIFGITLISATMFIYWLINISSKYWWLWSWFYFSLLSLIFLFMEPFFKNYEPIGNSPIELKIAAIAKKTSIPLHSIVLESGGEEGRVIGLGPTRKIILNKNLFQTRDEKWTVQTVAHEAKHFVKDDNLKGFLAITLFLFVIFLILKTVSGYVIQKRSNTLGFNTINNPAFMPLAFIILTLTYLIAQPALNKFRQHVEFEADRFGLELTHENKALGQMIASWSTEYKGHVAKPSRFYMLFRASHPSDAERINFANTYFPWNEGKSLIYKK